jgi:hypothetical protein
MKELERRIAKLEAERLPRPRRLVWIETGAPCPDVAPDGVQFLTWLDDDDDAEEQCRDD